MYKCTQGTFKIYNHIKWHPKYRQIKTTTVNSQFNRLEGGKGAERVSSQSWERRCPVNPNSRLFLPWLQQQQKFGFNELSGQWIHPPYTGCLLYHPPLIERKHSLLFIQLQSCQKCPDSSDYSPKSVKNKDITIVPYIITHSK